MNYSKQNLSKDVLLIAFIISESIYWAIDLIKKPFRWLRTQFMRRLWADKEIIGMNDRLTKKIKD